VGGAAAVRLLLDTHIWLWSLIEPACLSQKVSRELKNTQNEIWLSPISVWETLLLAHKGRVMLDGKPELWIREALLKSNLREASLNNEIAITSLNLNLSHGDPADRFLAATAIVYDLTLVTADKRLLRCRQYKTLANRMK
jgi:PIN domain nuclease of toxin-antitoxin system